MEGVTHSSSTTVVNLAVSAIEISRRGIYDVARSQLRRLLAPEKVLLNNKFFSSNGRLGPSLLVYPALAHNVGLTFRQPLAVLYCAGG